MWNHLRSFRTGGTLSKCDKETDQSQNADHGLAGRKKRRTRTALHGLQRLEDRAMLNADTVGLFRADLSLFQLKESFLIGAADHYSSFGPPQAEWVPITGDWNGDGNDTIGLYQPDSSLFHLKNSVGPGASDYYFTFGPSGNAGWVPLVGDWDGDGVDTVGLYQPDAALFHLKNSHGSGTADVYAAFGPAGLPNWSPMVGDWNGDGYDTIGLYQSDISLFHLKDSITPGPADHYVAFGPGGSGWKPLSGDWNGDGIDTIGMFQPSSSLFHLKDSLTPGASDRVFAFGPANQEWVPLTGNWNGPDTSMGVDGPQVFYTDILSGPNIGGENNHGTYLSIFGTGFGESQGNSRVLINGTEVAAYKYWGQSQYGQQGIQQITIQPGANVSSGVISVEVNGIESNLDHTFTVKQGSVYFVSLDGDDSTGVPDDITKPYRNAWYAMHDNSTGFGAGDTVVIRGGSYTNPYKDSGTGCLRLPEFL